MNNGNIFLDMFSLVNKIYTVEDYMLSDNIPKGISDFFYISKGIELEGKYFNFENEFINVYVIKDSNNHSLKDTIFFDNKPVVIIVIPSVIDGVSTSEINTHRVNMIKYIYKYLFRFLSRKLNVPVNSSLSKLLNNAPSVLTLFSEIHTGQIFFNVEDMIDPDSDILEVEKLEKTIKYDVETLFVNGGLLNIL